MGRQGTSQVLLKQFWWKQKPLSWQDATWFDKSVKQQDYFGRPRLVGSKP